MLQRRAWVPTRSENLVQTIAAATAAATSEATAAEITRLVTENRRLHDEDGINLNPASNVMNPKAEALLASGLGSRASLGWPGDKYEMGLQAIERIEVVAAELAAEVFGAHFAEVRVASGALANLYVFMATCQPGDTIIAPPAEIGGHVTHHAAGAAGLYGLKTVPAPVHADGYTVDVDALRTLAHQVKPALITLGGSLNLFPHPVAAVRAIADEVGATLMFDAAHLSGMIAGGAWANPLAEGADVMTMSTYKSLGGPPGGLVVGNDAALFERIDAIAYPGLTANFDAGKTAALALGLLDWKDYGRDYAATMQATARALAEALSGAGLPVYARERGMTESHQFAVEAARWGGGQAAARRLERARLLACGIGLPTARVAAIADDVNGLRLGVPEIVRLGFGPAQMAQLGALIVRALEGVPEAVAPEVTALRRRVANGALRFVRA
ncbi:serine hydroxymethyltransferase [Rubrivivax gelatinosus]|uniref:Serine hydroxymethyltransferase n=1 Tax=Rubrivivax gelatinosus TaxID=28068 RepID=A0ABS1DQ22_RUBGE|nr:aminotransferase class I/II-fold pyridoxal phosphate-dependent enzyme [Rubrivivax gelatinosus]MBK1615458.1 serine hydroxymethyltransferase [Rubrivivax gelatinosus]MBK1712056.1 serine hydroxymethyltransferase [Rubrivivax gelatinosus]